MIYLLENSPTNSHTWARHIRNLAEKYDIEDPLSTIQREPPSKKEYSQNILVKITSYHERELRKSAETNSKMQFLNINVKGLNGRPHPALRGAFTTKESQKLRAHIKLLSSDLYTYEIKASYQGGSPHCRFCEGSDTKSSPSENISHILTKCSAYSNIRNRIFHQMEILCSSSNSGINFKKILSSNQLSQFVLDCTSLNLPMRINESDEICERLFKLSRDLCSGIIKTRSNLIKQL